MTTDTTSIVEHLYERAERRARYLELVSQIDQHVSDFLDADRLLDHATSLIHATFSATHTHILLRNDTDHTFVLRYSVGIGAAEMLALPWRIDKDEGRLGQLIRTGQPFLEENLNPTLAYPSLLRNTRAELGVAIYTGEHIIGILTLQNDDPTGFDSEDITVLEILGRRLGSALERKRLFEELQWRYNALVAVHDTSLDIVAQLERQRVLDALLGRGARLLDAEEAVVYLLDEQRENLIVAAHLKASDNRTGVSFPLGVGISSKAILTGIPQMWDGVSDYPDKPLPFRDDPAVRALLVPLNWQNERIGALGVYRNLSNPAFNINDAWMLEGFADLASIAIKNAEWFGQVTELTHDLERRVEQRTTELVRAKQDIAAKADQLRSLLQKTVTLQEAERARISRDMHDGVVQFITAIRYELKAAQLTADPALPENTQVRLGSVREMLDELEREIRAAIYDLQPPLLDFLGLIPALEKYITRFQEITGVTTTLRLLGDVRALTAPIELGVFRLVEESLHNITRHAHAQSVSITLDYRVHTLRASVRDDGQGFDYHAWMQDHDPKNLGLFGMQERARALGGNLKIWSRAKKGTHILFELPIQPAEALAPIPDPVTDL